jgi:hypothetical protein
MKPTPTNATVSSICDSLVARAADRVLAIGPLLWQPSDGTSTKLWYFIVGSADDAKEFHTDQIIVDSETPEADRADILTELITRRPLVVHTFDDEVTMARWCAAIWPCDKTVRLRRSVEAEYEMRE